MLPIGLASREICLNQLEADYPSKGSDTSSVWNFCGSFVIPQRHCARKPPVTSRNFSRFLISGWPIAPVNYFFFSFQDILRTLLANGILASFAGLIPRYTVASTRFTVFTVELEVTTAMNMTESLICMTTKNPCEISVGFIRQRCTLRYSQILQIVK